MDPQSAIAVISGEDRSGKARSIRLGLRIAEPVYTLAVRLRNKLFDAGIKKSHDLGRPTISIGNLTTGGTGKTPMVIDVVERLVALGHSPAVLLRGYTYRGSPLGESDESRMLQNELGAAVPVAPNPDRVDAARRVLVNHPGVSAFVLDDGFQHRRAKRALDLVLLDATHPFGFNRVLPAGLMREPIASLRRASAIILTRADVVPPQGIADIRDELRRRGLPEPIAEVAGVWRGARDEKGNLHDLAQLKSEKVWAVCGIGNPEQFALTTARELGRPVGMTPFRDHQVYTGKILRMLSDRARQRGATVVVTTEKDWVKWRPILDKGLVFDLPIYRPVLRVKYLNGEEKVAGLLKEAAG